MKILSAFSLLHVRMKREKRRKVKEWEKKIILKPTN